jgi:hypothetical protein
MVKNSSYYITFLREKVPINLDLNLQYSEQIFILV